MKLCVIYNFAQHYRSNIFKLIDSTFDCEWYFGETMGDIKKMDYSILSHTVHEMPKRIIGPFIYQCGVPSLIKEKYTHYLLLPDTRSLSSWLFLLMSRLYRKKKVFIWTHGWYGKENLIERIIKKIMFRLPNGGIFCYGNYARNLMIKEGFNAQKIHTIHNSLFYDRQLQVRDQLKETSVYKDHFFNVNKNLLFIGRLTAIKKLDQILKAMVICRDRGTRYNLTFIGDGEKTEELMLLAKSLGLERQVWFYGSCYDEKELSMLIYNADLCVAPGNIGLTAMHSMVFGTPCITHDDFPYQMPEFEAIKNGVTGSFFKRDNVDNLAAQIDRWFKDNGQKREEIRRACMKEIDDEWNPYFQIEVLKKYLK